VPLAVPESFGPHGRPGGLLPEHGAKLGDLLVQALLLRFQASQRGFENGGGCFGLPLGIERSRTFRTAPMRIHAQWSGTPTSSSYDELIRPRATASVILWTQ
jgi:hypothetical protein